MGLAIVSSVGEPCVLFTNLDINYNEKPNTSPRAVSRILDLDQYHSSQWKSLEKNAEYRILIPSPKSEQ